MKQLLLASLAFATFTATAQTSKPKNAGKESIKIAPELGLNISNYTVTEGSTTENTSSHVGLRLGGYLDVAMTQNIYLQPGLYYARNGSSLTDDGGGSGDTYKLVTKVNTINVPVNVVYKLGKAGDNRFFAGGGLVLTYNMGGTITETATSSGSSESHTVDLKVGSTSEDHIKGMDIGVNLVAGYQLRKGFLFKLGYQHGFVNLEPGDSKDAKMTSHGFSITAAYVFDMKKKGSGK